MSSLTIREAQRFVGRRAVQSYPKRLGVSVGAHYYTRATVIPGGTVLGAPTSRDVGAVKQYAWDIGVELNGHCPDRKPSFRALWGTESRGSSRLKTCSRCQHG